MITIRALFDMFAILFPDLAAYVIVGDQASEVLNFFGWAGAFLPLDIILGLFNAIALYYLIKFLTWIFGYLVKFLTIF